MEERLNELEKRIANLEKQDWLSIDELVQKLIDSVQEALVIQPNNRYRKELLQVLDGMP